VQVRWKQQDYAAVGAVHPRSPCPGLPSGPPAGRKRKGLGVRAGSLGYWWAVAGGYAVEVGVSLLVKLS